jgi:hypothetical protein
VRMRWVAYLLTMILAGAAGEALVGSAPLGAVSREMIGLQQGVAQLMQGQKNLETNMAQDRAVRKTLIELSLDSVNKLDSAVDATQKTVQVTQANSSARLDTMFAQIQTISDSLQEIQDRTSKFNQQLVDTQNAIQGIDAKLASPLPPAAVPKRKVPRADGTSPDGAPGEPARAGRGTSSSFSPKAAGWNSDSR